MKKKSMSRIIHWHVPIFLIPLHATQTTHAVVICQQCTAFDYSFIPNKWWINAYIFIFIIPSMRRNIKRSLITAVDCHASESILSNNPWKKITDREAVGRRKGSELSFPLSYFTCISMHRYAHTHVYLTLLNHGCMAT